jgi:hypothetical protein
MPDFMQSKWLGSLALILAGVSPTVANDSSAELTVGGLVVAVCRVSMESRI